MLRFLEASDKIKPLTPPTAPHKEMSVFGQSKALDHANSRQAHSGRDRFKERPTISMADVVEMKLRIVVADDNSKILSTLVSALSIEFEVIATATDGRSALYHIERLLPAVAVLDLNMPELNGIEITREIVRQRLTCNVVICSVENDPELIAAALAAGARGYVLKPRLNKDLAIAVRCAACGESFVSGS